MSQQELNSLMPPQGLTNDEDNLEKLPGDDSTPFSAPSDTFDKTDDTHPEADTNVDAHEQYDEGIAGAIEVDEPRSTGILGYNKKPHSRHEEFNDES